MTLPAFDCKLTEIDGKPHVYCLVRRRFLVLTPEEWVRQHLVNLLLTQYDYPKSLIRTEGGLRLNGLAKRSDLLVYDRAGAPFLLVECKAPTVPLTAAVLEQAARYNHVLGAPFLAVSNGRSHGCFQVSAPTLTLLSDWPAYP